MHDYTSTGTMIKHHFTNNKHDTQITRCTKIDDIHVILTQIHYYGLSPIAIISSTFNYQSRKKRTRVTYPFKRSRDLESCARAHQPKPSKQYRQGYWGEAGGKLPMYLGIIS